MKPEKNSEKQNANKMARGAVIIPESTDIALMRFILDRRLKGERWSKNEIFVRGVELFFERTSEGGIVK